MNDKLKPLSENINKEKIEKFTKEHSLDIFETSPMAKYVMEYDIKIREQLEENIFCAITQIALENGIKYEYAINKDFVVKALEKQIPKKPKYIEGDYDMPLCPCCGMSVDENEEKHCSVCGQALDRGDNE